MTAQALLLAAALVAPLHAGEVSVAADTVTVESPFTRLQTAAEPADRISACVELAQPPHRGPRAYQALSAAMNRDLSERVRLAAAVAAITFPGGQTLNDLGIFLKSEPGAQVRRELLIAMSTASALFDNPDAARLMATSLSEDPSPEVRLGAAEALGARGDPLVIGDVRRAAEKDESKEVREAARRTLGILSKPPKPKPKAKLPDPPKPDAVFGKDPCPRPWGWCGCSGAIKLKPKCLTREECRSLQADMRHHDLDCNWDGHSED